MSSIQSKIISEETGKMGPVVKREISENKQGYRNDKISKEGF